MLIISFNQIIFLLAAFELFIGIVFIIPLPKGWKPGLLRFVEESPTVKKLLQYHNFIIFIVALHWMYSVKAANDLQVMHKEEKAAHFNTVNSKDLFILENKFRAEGEIYLNGTLLFASIFVNRLIALLQYYYQIKQMSELELKVDLSKDLKTILGPTAGYPAAAQTEEKTKSKVEKKND